ncbi:TIGR01621 family pseudouridine synthase [Parashewanella spongiae]|uniref:TIGR01621 family pseudouridine synthase n=1 Tax=Parashewanella spongiae TaxID=342950 RepID=A0A3A6U641_9GAMM|nr:TIGR01621 family pseudouridine synthase [Parashewanella spongiae]MCL1078073.1 TIGR01621 family pseudouridine synthase [Parashewanella spongiae]RJY16946.1 TIGR01621 family pseudouridine synthase [Parashewanella spongiae]
MPAKPYQLIAETDEFIVINKSSGVHFHSQHGEAGLVATVEQDKQQKLFAVHRLDTPTSGLLLLAKSSKSAHILAEKFKHHQIQKYYLAIAQGKPKKKQGWVIGDMTKSRRGQMKLLKTKENPAITQFFSHSFNEGLRLYLLKPHTGKTHQLRVALASLGVPILGDPLYGKLASDRCYLHAFCLLFEFAGKEYSYSCLPNLQRDNGVLFAHNKVVQQVEEWRHPHTLNWPQAKKKDSK